MRRAVALLAFALAAQPALAKQPPPGFGASLPQPTGAVAHPADGSILNLAAGYTPLITGARAHNVGDTLTIILAESTSSTKSAATKTQRAGAASITPPTSGPFAINPNALNAAAQSSFNGQGNTLQTNAFTGTVAVTIAEVRPNDTLLVRGEKRMLLSQGDEWIQFSGIVRLADIDEDNNVLSTRVADVRMEYAGNGAIQRSAREGWLSWLFSKVSPF
ncbi:MAG: flagellar basal body L-ring protein FlgH [Sphingomonadales bacterium]|nr:flagellar basal body L-ring protein FlgH [Sphingomonadales bacterium]